MKKNLIRGLAAALGAACVLTFAACGGNNSSKTGSGTSSTATSSTVSSDSTGLGLNENGKFNTVADFVNSDIIQSQLEAQMKQVEESGMTIDISGEDNKLIYTYTYSEAEIEESDIETMAAALETAMETQASTFETVASSLKAAVETENPVVVVRYMTSDGQEIYSQEFTPSAE